MTDSEIKAMLAEIKKMETEMNELMKDMTDEEKLSLLDDMDDAMFEKKGK